MKVRWYLSLCAGLLIASSAVAQPVGIGVTKGTAVNQIGTALAKAVSAHTDVQMRTQTMGGSQQYIDQMNGGRLEFGLINTVQFAMNYFGTQVAKGKKRDNIRIVASLVPFRSGLLTPRSSGLKTLADLKGKRIPSGLSSAPIMVFFTAGMLANGGLGWDDVEKVPVTGLRQGFKLLKEGKVDATLAAVGAGHVKELGATISGGVRFLSLDPSPEAVKRLNLHVPRTLALPVEPSRNLPGIPERTYTLGYYYTLSANKNVSDAVVMKVVKAIAENEKEIKASSPGLWRSYSTKIMSLDHNLPYHPGAIAYYKQAGMWNR